MLIVQILVNGLVLGGLYACIAIGFSLVWGVLNVINILHGSFIVLGAYIAYCAYISLGIHPFVSVVIAGGALFILAYLIQITLINRVITEPVMTTLILTFGLGLVLDNAMIVGFKADYRKLNLAHPLGVLDIAGVVIPLDRLAAMALALLLTGLLYWVLSVSRVGRAIVAVRMDREAAALMGVDVKRIYALTFGLGGVMTGAAGSLLSTIFPFSPVNSFLYLGKAFVICVLGGLGSVSGAVVGGLALGVIESFSGLVFGPEQAMTVSFILLIILLRLRPTGLTGRRGYE